MNWFEWVERAGFVFTSFAFLYSVYQWKTARPRTKAHVFGVMLTGAVILIQVPDLLKLSNTGQTISLALTLVFFVYVIRYGAGIRKARGTRDEAQ